MLKMSGKPVNFLRTVQGIGSVRPSTAWYTKPAMSNQYSEQLSVTPILSTLFHWSFPLLKRVFSPLSEHYLYPVSTAPIISPSQKKFKER